MPGPSNLYGVANAVGAFAAVGLGSDVVCPANTETTVLTTSNIIAPSQGYFFAVCFGFVNIAIGATGPTFVSINFYVNGGSTIGNPSIPTQMLTANAAFQQAYIGYSGNMQVPWVAPGSPIRFTVNPSAQAITIRALGTGLYILLVHGPDA